MQTAVVPTVLEAVAVFEKAWRDDFRESTDLYGNPATPVEERDGDGAQAAETKAAAQKNDHRGRGKGSSSGDCGSSSEGKAKAIPTPVSTPKEEPTSPGREEGTLSQKDKESHGRVKPSAAAPVEDAGALRQSRKPGGEGLKVQAVKEDASRPKSAPQKPLAKSGGKSETSTPMQQGKGKSWALKSRIPGSLACCVKHSQRDQESCAEAVCTKYIELGKRGVPVKQLPIMRF